MIETYNLDSAWLDWPLEFQVIGSFLKWPSAFRGITQPYGVTASWFDIPVARRIFGMMQDCDGDPNPAALVRQLEGEARTTFINCWLNPFLENGPTAGVIDPEGLVQDLRHEYTSRLAKQRFNPNAEDLPTHLREIQSEIEKIAPPQTGLRTIRDVIESTIEDIENRLDPAKRNRVSTGIGVLDECIGGFEPGCLYTIAARTGMGKTALACTLAANITQQSARVLFFTVEMIAEEICRRLMAIKGRLGMAKLKSGDLSTDELDRVMYSAREIAGLPIQIVDDFGASFPKLANIARTQHAKNPLKVVVVDYIQLLSNPTGKRQDHRHQEIGQITMGLKSLAKELRCAVIALAQLNREADKGPASSPQLSHLQGSDSIAQDSDVVILIHRENHQLGSGKKSTTETENFLLVQKNRNGPTGKMRVKAEMHRGWFGDET